jgi:concanavalin A-like lectin/glucanase superfamily protein
MAVTTVNVSGRVPLPNDTNPANCIVRFTLSQHDTDALDGTTLLPHPMDVQADAGGEVSINLWPNDRGIRNTWYAVSAKVTESTGNKVYPLGLINVTGTTALDLEDILSVSVADSPDVDFTASVYAALAQQWAEEAEDVAVTTGKFSALHHSAKSAGYAADALASAQAAQAGDPPALSITLTGYTPVDVLTGSMADWSDGGVNMRMIQPSLSWYNEARPSGSWLGEAANETAARALTGAGTGDYYHNTTDGKFYSLDATSGETEVFRGPRQGFPEEYAIVAEAARVIIFDVNDNNAMWMVFTGPTESASPNSINALGGGASTKISVDVLDGEFIVGRNSTAQSSVALRWQFLQDRYGNQGNNTAWGGWAGNISQRNTLTPLDASLPTIVNSAVVNDVAITALPDAPINQTTGMPEPTIAVATDGGVSQIGWNGSSNDNVWDITCADSSFTASYIVSYEGAALWLSQGNTERSVDNVFVFNDPLTADTALTLNSKTGTGQNADAWYKEHTALGDLYLTGGSVQDKLNTFSNGVVGSDDGLNFLRENPATPASGMVAFTTSDWFSGFQVGDSLAAWLASTTAETLTGTDLVTNGVFATDTDWTKGTGWTIGSGVASCDGTQTANSDLSQSLPISAAEVYVVNFDLARTAGAINYVALGGTTDGSDISANGNHSITVTTINGSGNLIIGGDVNFVGTIDNVTVRLADPDRSVKGNGLQAFGSLTKAVVATGADLVAFSGFSPTDYLEQPYNSDLDLGTGDFCVMGWVKGASTMSTAVIVDRLSALASGFQFYKNTTSGVPSLIFRANGVTHTATTGSILDNWAHVVAKRDGSVLTLWVDGEQVYSATETGDISGTTPVLKVGYSSKNPLIAYLNGISLLRIGTTAPSANQIREIYEYEKHLFNENAACTLFGGSDAIVDQDYDDGTGLHHFLTSAGESVFRGLVRVSEEAGSETKISANNGLVVKI